ncbi:secretion/conjugation apparatus DotM-related subunit [Pseudoxanthomonas kaohsiungensis]|uniref:DotM C-terminal cytoplasmic domain-containing protein n=1 Tax=Pseudoxanthomonas kaohsiungensis TaxID=283923 RepID=A0ABW3LZ47_9GAMM|nr:hypothetical protein [Pseudoxanthomonas kaohsiungensis]
MKGRDTPTKDTDALPWGAIAGVLLVVMMWFIFHEPIARGVMWIRWAEAHLLILDPEGKAMLAQWLGTVSPPDATLMQLIESGAVAGYSLRWFSLAFLAALFGWIYLKAPSRNTRMSRKYTMKSLAMQEGQTYPTLQPVLGLGLENVPLDDPVNGMRQEPRFYARRHGLVLPRWTAPADVPNTAMVLADGRFFLSDRAKSIFGSQLGRPWQGPAELKPFERTLFAAFIAQINHDDKLAQEIINGVAVAWNDAMAKRDPSLLTTPRVESTIEKYADSPAVVALVRQHYHVRCVLRRLLSAARENGKLPPAWFRWLKMADRTTWYVLNDLGLNVASVEAAGVHAHYLAECMAKTAIPTPMVQPAIDGTVEALNTLEDDQEL